ncbi:hypothetical protein KTR9_1283 [Gordonia sp. KTR9]|nr:hypothetical protein KTR9_1283 [Gordonia sp. KTR9]
MRCCCSRRRPRPSRPSCPSSWRSPPSRYSSNRFCAAGRRRTSNVPGCSSWD